MLGRLSLCVSGVTNGNPSKYKERFKEFFADHLGSYVAFRLVSLSKLVFDINCNDIFHCLYEI